jgi:uncharacterized protein YeaO (DUF488 family)
MQKTVNIYTCRVQDHRALKAAGVQWLDTTVKTGSSVFAPTWDMVMAWKAGTLSDEEYSVQYRQRMEDSWNNHADVWLKTLDTDQLVLGCFCPPNTFCHRRLLAKMFVRVASVYTHSHAIYCGEYPLYN